MARWRSDEIEEALPFDEPLKGETSKQYFYFCIYRDLGPSRSIKEVARRVNKHHEYLERISRKNYWVERARLYDAHIAKKVAEEREKELEEMLKRHINIAVAMQVLVSRELQELLEKAEAGEVKLTPVQLSRLFEVAVKVERLARGEPTEIEEKKKGPVIIEVYSEEEDEGYNEE